MIFQKWNGLVRFTRYQQELFVRGFLTEAFHEDRNELYYKPKLPDLKMQSDFYECP